MPVDPELLKLLVCPEDHTPLTPAPAHLLERLNEAVHSGSLVNRSGERVTEPLIEGLLRTDGLRLYPVRDDIPVMLLDEAIDVEPAAQG